VTITFFNALWLVVSASAFAVIVPRVPGRRGRAVVIVACAMALLFPIISISDDFAADRGSIEQLLATLVLVFITVALAALARVTPVRTYAPSFTPATKSDPRSPPRR